MTVDIGRICAYVLAVPVLPIFAAELSENAASGEETGGVTKIFAPLTAPL